MYTTGGVFMYTTGGVFCITEGVNSILPDESTGYHVNYSLGWVEAELSLGLDYVHTKSFKLLRQVHLSTKAIKTASNVEA